MSMAQEAACDADALIAALRAAGAQRFDPVRLHYIEALARRAQAHEGQVRHMLDARLAQAIAEFKARQARARREAEEALVLAARQFEGEAEALRPLLEAGDFKGIHTRIASLAAFRPGPGLLDMVRELDGHRPASDDPAALAERAARPELRTLRESRSTWSRLSVDRQLSRALDQAPRNAGPINSHMLMVRSLEMMRDISPDYLGRFISWADTLLRLAPGEKERAEKPKKTRSAKGSGRRS